MYEYPCQSDSGYAVVDFKEDNRKIIFVVIGDTLFNIAYAAVTEFDRVFV